MPLKLFYDNYFESVYKNSNVFSKEQYQKNNIDFDDSYKKFLPSDKNASFLDIGCGTGYFLYYLKQRGYHDFYGIDISEEQINYCKNNVSENVECCDVFNFLKNLNKKYDCISAHDVFEHIDKEKTLEFIKLVYSSLNINGIFIVRVPNMNNPFSLVSMYGDFTHETGFADKSIHQVLRVGGFRDIEILPPKKIQIRSFKNFIRKILVNILRAFIRFCYYIQDFSVPKVLDGNLVAVARKK